ncbi:MAG: hypothetical protein J1E00_01955 [Oscillospiraceae bacterium]|nr:hypothetical protein [Oscillospiraceae bacterium]
MNIKTPGDTPVHKLSYPTRCLALLLCVLMLLGIFGQNVHAETYEGIFEITLTKNDGSFNQTATIDSFYRGETPIFTWSQVLGFDDESYESFAAEMAQSLKTEFTFSVTMYWHANGPTQRVAIVDVVPTLGQAKDSAGNNRWCLVFRLILDPQDTVKWANEYGSVEANLQVFGAEAEEDPNAPKTRTNITKWRLVKADGSFLESSQGGNTITLNERRDFASEDEARAYAAQLLEDYPQFCVEDNYSPWLDAQPILQIEFAYFATNGAMYQVTTRDTFRWHTNHGGQVAQFSILVPDTTSPVERRNVNHWRLVLKGSDSAVITADNDNSIYLLPNYIDGAELDDYLEFAQTILELYDFQVSFANGGYATYPVKSIYYQASDNYYLIAPEDNFYWTWGNALNPRVRVRKAGDAPITYRNSINWRLVGYSETTWIGNHLTPNGVDYAEKIEGRETEFAEDLKEQYLYLTVQQNESANWAWSTTLITDITYDAEKSAEYTSAIRKTAVYRVTVLDTYYDTNGAEAVFYIAFTGDGEFGDLDSITVKPKDPDGIRMNLFDYWINDADPLNENGNPWERYDWDQQYNWEDFDGGINYGHALKFFNMGYANEDRPWMRNQLGWWNYSTQNRVENIKRIVEPTLSMRYPKLSLHNPDYPLDTNTSPTIHSGTDEDAMEESLAYLFDPTMKQNGKASYANVTGLFQRNSDGYYYYDSKLNFAQYDNLFNCFLLFNDYGVMANSNESPNGQFFPFNNAFDVFTDVSEEADPLTGQRKLFRNTSLTSRADIFNHFFGFSMEIDFQQPMGGKVNAALGEKAQDMVFRFSGDDDVWIFVDGVLVLDLGGVHSGVYGEINFATGEVITGLMDPTKPGAELLDTPWTTDYLKDIFEAAGVGYGMENDGETWEGKAFASDTLHTIKVFYLERGHFDSNLALYFNLQARVPHKIYKVDEDGDPLAGTTFAIYAAKPSAGFKEGEPYHDASEFLPVNRDGSSATWETAEPLNAELVTDADGYVTLGGIDFANRAEHGNIYYFLKEISPSEGHRVLPEQIVLEYQPDEESPLRGVFRVLNPHETGAYASFSAILEPEEDELYYANSTVDPKTGEMTITRSEEEVIEDFHQESAMLFAVPMIYANIGDGMKWYPLCGSNTNGYQVVNIYSYREYFSHPDNTNHYTEDDPEGVQYAYRWALRHNLLAAAIRQTSNLAEPDWYFHYDTIMDSKGEVLDSRFTAELLNLPGEKDRYLFNNKIISLNSADLRMVGLLVDAESVVALINSIGGSVTLEQFKLLSDEDKYLLLQDTLSASGFEDRWNQIYYDDTPDWSPVRSRLDSAYTENTEGTQRTRGVNLAYIDTFIRYYGSVFYIPNERRELRVRKEDPNGDPLAGAVFGLFDSFDDAVNYTGEGDDVLVIGVTGENGVLIFSRSEDKSPANAGSGWALMNWDVYSDPDWDNMVWLREISAPKGFRVNESIVQVYVGEHSIYANASAYRAAKDGDELRKVDGHYVPELIDDLSNATDEQIRNGQWTDGVTVWAGIGKLFQSMEKYADPVLNSTLLDIDGRTSHFLPEGTYDSPEDGIWKETGELFRLHFWDRMVLGNTSSDYSTAHHRSADGSVGGDVFAVVENGYLQVRPTQTPDNIFFAQHAGANETGVRESRRSVLYRKDGTPLDLYNMFSPVCGVVIRDDYEGDADLRITKVVKGDAPEAEEKSYTFLVTGPEEAAGETFDVEGATESTVTFTKDAPYTAEVTVKGAGTITLKKLPAGTYTVAEYLDGAQIDGYTLEVRYSAEHATVEEGKTASFTATNSYRSDLQECKLTITDGGHYGEENCGEETEHFLYKVTGTTLSGEKIELLVSVPGGGSTTVVVPPGDYVVEELRTWSWKYKNKKTVGDAPESEWTISADWITAKRRLQVTEEKEVTYYHELSDKTWASGETSADNRFTPPSASSEEQERVPDTQQTVLPAALEEERKLRFLTDDDTEGKTR